MAGLTETEIDLLHCMAQGSLLKVHRSLDGEKHYRLHPLTGPTETVAADLVDALLRRNLLQSNMKFPAATFLLTPRGRSRLDADLLPLSTHRALGYDGQSGE